MSLHQVNETVQDLVDILVLVPVTLFSCFAVGVACKVFWLFFLLGWNVIP